MPLTEQSIRVMLEITDPNIHFTEDCRIETIRDREAIVWPAVLSYQPDCCVNCGFATSLVKYGFNENLITAPGPTFRPVYVRLKRQRFKCRHCGNLFDADSSFIDFKHRISQPTRQMILFESLRNSSMVDIADRYFVSDKTVQRVINEEAALHAKRPKLALPMHMAFDEFKATKTMSFIWCDSDSHQLGDILYSRKSRDLTYYFEGFPLATRAAVKTITVDLNAGYINLIPRLFPNAKIIVDRFHIVQMLGNALNTIRIQVMKFYAKSSAEYRFMKREWKLFKQPIAALESKTKTYHASVRFEETSLNLVSHCVDLDPKFRAAYEVYQTALAAIAAHNTTAMTELLSNYQPLDNNMDRPMKSLYQHLKQVNNALTYEYSNGYLEGIIGRIKKIKNVAFGFRNWVNMKTRIFEQLSWFDIRRHRRNILG